MSAETGHTPGPWDADGWMDNGNHSISASGGAAVCEVYEPENVPLIAAAPDLLAALNEALPWVAIATANDDVTVHPQRTANHARALEMARLAILKATTP